MRGTAGDDKIWLVVDADKRSVHLHQVLHTMLVDGDKCSVHQVLEAMPTQVQEQCGELLE